MVVLILERAPAGLRGELSRWMIEPQAGVFVGKMSAMVRDKLWEKACQSAKGAAAILLYASPTEQGFAVRTHGQPGRSLVEVEGLMLVRLPRKPPAPEKKPASEKKPPPEAAPPPADWVPG